MIRKLIIHSLKAFILISAFFLSSCNTALYFDQYAYKESISIKVESLELMDKATEDYTLHIEDIQEVRLSMLKIYEYEKYRPNNEESTKMWALMLNPEKNLFQGFIERWKAHSTMSPLFIKESKLQMEEAFDLIIGFEKKKIK